LQVIRSYHRLLDLRGKHTDVEVLKILTNAIINDLPDCDAKGSKRLLEKALTLMGRLTSVVCSVNKQKAASKVPKTTQSQEYSQSCQYAGRFISWLPLAHMGKGTTSVGRREGIEAPSPSSISLSVWEVGKKKRGKGRIFLRFGFFIFPPFIFSPSFYLIKF